MLGTIAHAVNTSPVGLFTRDAQTILDVGCGSQSPVRHVVQRNQVVDGIDITPSALPNDSFYRHVFCADIRTFQPTESYDIVTAFDLIEHLERPEGEVLLDSLEQIAKKRVVILTPNGFVPQAPTPDNPYQEHKSGWSADDFRRRGYRVYGMFGPRPLRTGTANIRYEPRMLWAAITMAAAIPWFWLPDFSFSLLAVRNRP